MRSILISLLLVLTSSVFANEPLWTAQERQDHRDAVLQGTVLRITKIAKINDHEDLMSADIRVSRVLKAHPNLPQAVITVYYQTSPKGASYRCPTYAVLSPAQSATFYLRFHDYLTKKKDFLIEIGSDVSVSR